MYVLNLFFLKDGPLIQIYISISLQLCYLSLFLFSKPYDTKRGNREELTFICLTILLMASCLVFETEFKTA